MTQEQNPQIPTDTAPEEAGSLDAAALAFEQRAQGPETADTEDEAVTETADADPDAEATGESDEDTEQTAELREIDFEGLKISVPADEAEKVEKALLRQADYSRKMNEVSAKEKSAQQRIEQAETLAKSAERYAGALAQVQMLDQQIKQFEALDWQALRSSDPATYAAYSADFNTARLTKAQVMQQAQAIGHEVQQAELQSFAVKREEMDKTLRARLKGWGEDMQRQITQYAIDGGIAFETLSKVTDPALVIALDKARKFDALQANKATLKAKASSAPPVLKPGAAPRQSDAKTDTLARLRKSNSLDDAASAFLARMR